MARHDHSNPSLKSDRLLKPARVAVVDDESCARTAFRQILEHSPECRCLGIYASAREALECLPESRTELVLMDIRMPGMSGIDCAWKLKSVCPQVKILMVTAFSEVQVCLESFQAGACGYITKPFARSSLLSAIHLALAGDTPMTQDISRKLLDYCAPGLFSRPSPFFLTKRELEIMPWLSQGLGDKQIADVTHLSINTVQFHLKQIRHKFHVQSRTAAVMRWTNLQKERI